MRLGDLDALSAFVGDLRSTLHKEQSTFKAMKQSEFEIKDNMLLNFQYAIDNAPTVDFVSPTIKVNIPEETKQKLIEELRKAHKLLVLPEPEVTFERPQGEWIIVKDDRYGDNVKCPFCGKELAGTDLNFCCKCGAKLVGSEKMNGGAE